MMMTESTMMMMMMRRRRRRRRRMRHGVVIGRRAPHQQQNVHDRHLSARGVALGEGLVWRVRVCVCGAVVAPTPAHRAVPTADRTETGP
jgi:hypothetical protein